MSTPQPLLMIPGPVEVSPAVLAAASAPPPGHTAPRLIEAFGTSIERMREVWQADAASQPFILAGSGTLAMEMAAANLVEPGERALVVNTGYFSERMSEILRRAGALAVFDGVCATAGERFEMAVWEADLYFTGSQKAIGLPPGLALMVAGERALAARAARRAGPPPLFLDWHSWLPIHRAYEERRPSYFATPATSLVMALETGLGEILAEGIEARIEAHARAAAALRAAWSVLGLRSVPRSDVMGNTLSVLLFPEGIDASLLPRIAARGVTVAGGLHPAVKATSFRVGHMGDTVTRPDYLRRTVEAVAGGLQDAGASVDVAGAVRAFEGTFEQG